MQLYCHEHPDMLVVQTTVAAAWPGKVALAETPFIPAEEDSSPTGASCAGMAARPG